MINKAILVGRLTADPELKQTNTGIPVVSFSIAIDRPYTPKDGGQKQTDFIDIVAWRSNAEFISKYFRKGNAIGIDGSIQTRNYVDKDNNKRKAVEVVVDRASFVESKAAAQVFSAPPLPSSFDAPPERNVSYLGDSAHSGNSSYSSGSADDFEEIEGDGDLPF